jgi:hypothetical protein
LGTLGFLVFCNWDCYSSQKKYFMSTKLNVHRPHLRRIELLQEWTQFLVILDILPMSS